MAIFTCWWIDNSAQLFAYLNQLYFNAEFEANDPQFLPVAQFYNEQQIRVNGKVSKVSLR